MEEQKIYRIELTEKQMKLIASSLESISRMYCGQIEPSYHAPLDEKMWNMDSDKRDRVEKLFAKIKGELWEELGGHERASMGIGYHKTADHLYDMYKTILYLLEEENKEDKESKGEKYNGNVHSRVLQDHTDNPRIKVIQLTKDILRDEAIDELNKH